MILVNDYVYGAGWVETVEFLRGQSQLEPIHTVLLRVRDAVEGIDTGKCLVDIPLIQNDGQSFHRLMSLVSKLNPSDVGHLAAALAKYPIDLASPTLMASLGFKKVVYRRIGITSAVLTQYAMTSDFYIETDTREVWRDWWRIIRRKHLNDYDFQARSAILWAQRVSRNGLLG